MPSLNLPDLLTALTVPWVSVIGQRFWEPDGRDGRTDIRRTLSEREDMARQARLAAHQRDVRHRVNTDDLPDAFVLRTVQRDIGSSFDDVSGRCDQVGRDEKAGSDVGR